MDDGQYDDVFILSIDVRCFAHFPFCTEKIEKSKKLHKIKSFSHIKSLDHCKYIWKASLVECMHVSLGPYSCFGRLKLTSNSKDKKHNNVWTPVCVLEGGGGVYL